MRTLIIIFSNSLVIGAGGSMFLVSFLVQQQVTQALLGGFVLSIVMALTLEASKVAAILWAGYVRAEANTFSLRVVSALLRSGLIVLSMVCTGLFLAEQLDSPLAQQYQQAVMVSYIDEHEVERGAMQARHKIEVQRFVAEQHHAREQVLGGHKTHRDTVAADFRAEIDNRINGTFKGPRYYEFKRQLREAEQQLQVQSDVFTAHWAARSEAMHQTQGKETQQLMMEHRALLTQLNSRDFHAEDGAQHPMLMGFIRMSQQAVGIAMHPMQIAFTLALIISLLMELSIWLCFDIVGQWITPVLRSAHQGMTLSMERATEFENELVSDKIDDDFARLRARNKSQSVRQRMHDSAAAASASLRV